MNKILLLLLTVVFGLFFLAFGVYGVAMEFKTPPLHTVHLFFFGFSILLGAVLIPGVGPLIFGRLKDGVQLASPLVPTFGRRASQGEIAVAPLPTAPAPVPASAPAAEALATAAAAAVADPHAPVGTHVAGEGD